MRPHLRTYGTFYFGGLLLHFPVARLHTRRSVNGRRIWLGLVLFALLLSPLPAAERLAQPGTEDAKRHYTIQIQSAPAERRDIVRKTCRTLQEQGHIAYCQEAFVDGQRRVRLRLGAFATRAEAQDYAREFARQEACDYFVVPGDVYVDSFDNAFDVVTTPGGIWLKSADRTELLYRFGSPGRPGEFSPARISPTGQALAFYADSKIVKVDLTDRSSSILRDDEGRQTLFNVAVRWSPDGRHLAYLDRVGWEQPTKLWVVQDDGRNHRCLVGDDLGATAVKSFQWHPHNNHLFYVAGPAHGTVSVGGDLCGVDLAGGSVVLVPATPHHAREVACDFRIVGSQLHYRLAHFNETGRVDHYTWHTLPIAP